MFVSVLSAGTLELLLATCANEVVNGVTVYALNMFMDPWLGFLSEYTSVFQVSILALQAAYEAEIINGESVTSSNAQALQYALFVTTGIYGVVLFVVLTFIIVSPMLAARAEKRRLKEAILVNNEEAPSPANNPSGGQPGSVGSDGETNVQLRRKAWMSFHTIGMDKQPTTSQPPAHQADSASRPESPLALEPVSPLAATVKPTS